LNKILCIGLVFLFSLNGFSQKTAIKTFDSKSVSVEIISTGLDDLVIENSTSDTFEINLYAEDAEKHHIVIKEKYNQLTISFEAKEFQEPAVPVMKPITERLKRANAIIKIPKNRNLTIFGINNNISAINFLGNLSVSIENGIVKLGKVQKNTNVKLYAGNVFAFMENTNINVVSSLGKIKVNDTSYQKGFSVKDVKFKKNLTINTIKANIFLRITE
jgi:hypothetical protein